LLSHVRNRLSAQSTCALMCLGTWSLLGFVKDADVEAETILEDLQRGENGEDPEEPEFEDGYENEYMLQ
ncbi:hypothetical protein B0H13DRAFT_1655083, partial [Mycena leptocephala]